MAALTGALGVEEQQIAEALRIAAADTEDGEAEVPVVLGTTLMGSKGLEADHVFIVGLNKGVFPRTAAPSEEEVCQFLVALTRARKSVNLVSAGNWAGKWMKPSVFVTWLGDLVEEVRVRKGYFGA